MERPDMWVVIKVTSEDTETFYKVFASWLGGYLDGDGWRLNSGIANVTTTDTHYDFIGHSGSIYHCNKKSYGTSAYSNGILNNMIEKAKEANYNIEVLEDSFKFENLL